MLSTFLGSGAPSTYFPLSSAYDHPSNYLHSALQEIDLLANEDVEMQPPLSELATFLIVDTNILLHHFDALKQFVCDIENFSLPVMVVVPGAVVHELDGQKNRDGLTWLSRTATAWLLEKVRDRRFVKGQATEETCKSTGDWRKREPGETLTLEMTNDNLILDCCMYFMRERPTFLCSADKNLCILSQTQGIQTITPTSHWSSRDIVNIIYGTHVDSTQFGGYKKIYGNTHKDKAVDYNSMEMVDEESIRYEEEHSEDRINVLHATVIDHFTRLLVDLVGRVGGHEVRRYTSAEEEAQISRHAPRQRHFSEWNATECLKYLNSKRPGLNKLGNPKAEVFLLKAYNKEIPGSRTGREWSRQDWKVGLNNLKETGIMWEDFSILESLTALEPVVEDVFGR